MFWLLFSFYPASVRRNGQAFFFGGGGRCRRDRGLAFGWDSRRLLVFASVAPGGPVAWIKGRMEGETSGREFWQGPLMFIIFFFKGVKPGANQMGQGISDTLL